MFKFLIFVVLAYAFYKFLRVISGLFDKKKEDIPKQQKNEPAHIKKEDIIEAEFEDIETIKKDEKKV
jgi:hypothetical protein